MAESITEKLVQSIRGMNAALLEISEKTILSGPEVKNFPSSSKALWLREEEMLNAFRHSFEKFEVEDKLKALNNCNSPENKDKTRVTVTEKLLEQKTLVEKEIEKLLEEQCLLDSTIHKSITNLSPFLVTEKQPDEPFILIM